MNRIRANVMTAPAWTGTGGGGAGGLPIMAYTVNRGEGVETRGGGQRIIELFPTVNIFRLFKSKKRTGRGNQKCLKN